MLSFWESAHFTCYDYIVIGGGIVGLSAAMAVKEKRPSASVLVLERGIFPTGASTKNAGFACFGSLTELLADIRQWGENQTLTLVEKRWKGLQRLRERLGDAAIDFRNYGGYELLMEEQLPALSQITSINQLLSDLFGSSVFVVHNHLIDEFKFSTTHVKALVYNRFEGQIDTGKMMRSLWHLAQSKGITLLTGVLVTHLEEEHNEVRVWVKDAHTHQEFAFSAFQVGVCTNAFTSTLFPDIAISPGRGQVLITDPIEDLPFRGTFHLDEGFYYFRNVENRILLGGGRNLDFKGETTTELATTSHILQNLEEKLREIILPHQPFRIAQTWAGIMAFGDTKVPIVERISATTSLGVRMGGMGVAIGSLIGEELACIMTS